MFLQRAIVSFTLGPLALWLIYQGGLLYFVPISIILLLATIEYTHMMKNLGWQISPWVLGLAAALLWVTSNWSWPNVDDLALVIGLLLVMAYGLWRYEYRHSPQASSEWFAMMAGLVVLGWVGSHFFRLRNLPDMAWQWTMLAMLATWTADSGAYLVGKFLAGRVLGRHQMSPRLSPNKTFEGLGGGIILGTGFTVGIGMLLELPFLPVLVLGLLVSIVSPLGDLGISMLKRQAGVKDSGSLFPGHGGALDRVDSLLWSVTMAYYLVMLAL